MKPANSSKLETRSAPPVYRAQQAEPSSQLNAGNNLRLETRPALPGYRRAMPGSLPQATTTQKTTTVRVPMLPGVLIQPAAMIHAGRQMPGFRLAALAARYGRPRAAPRVAPPAGLADGGGAAVADGAAPAAAAAAAAAGGGGGGGRAGAAGPSSAARRRARARAAEARRNSAAAAGGGGAGGGGDRARVISNRQAQNMRESLVRMFGGHAGQYEIDQDSGRPFPDDGGTGHHDVQVTDTVTGRTFSTDFHQDGTYYTRG